MKKLYILIQSPRKLYKNYFTCGLDRAGCVSDPLPFQ